MAGLKDFFTSDTMKDVGKSALTGIAGGVGTYGQSYFQRSRKDIDERRKWALREKMADELGVMPEELVKLKEETYAEPDFNEYLAQQFPAFADYKPKQEETKLNMQPIKVGSKVYIPKESTKSPGTYYFNEYSADQFDEKGNLKSGEKKVASLKATEQSITDPALLKKAKDQGILPGGAGEGLKNIQEFLVDRYSQDILLDLKKKALAEKRDAYETLAKQRAEEIGNWEYNVDDYLDERLKPMADRLAKEQLSSKMESLREDFKEEQKKKILHYRRELHRQLPYLEDLMAMGQLAGKTKKVIRAGAPKNPKQRYNADNIRGSMGLYEKMIDKEIFTKVKGEQLTGIQSEQEKKLLENQFNNIFSQLGSFNTEGFDLASRSDKELITGEEAVPFLTSIALLPNEVNPMVKDARAMAQDENGTYQPNSAKIMSRDPDIRQALLNIVPNNPEASAQTLANLDQKGIDKLADRLGALKYAQITKYLKQENPRYAKSYDKWYKGRRGLEVETLFINSYKAYLNTLRNTKNLENFANEIYEE